MGKAAALGRKDWVCVYIYTYIVDRCGDLLDVEGREFAGCCGFSGGLSCWEMDVTYC